MNRSSGWKIWLGLFISAIFIYLAFRDVDPARLWRMIKSAETLPLFLVVVLTFLQYVIRAWRWSILLDPIKKTLFSTRLYSILIGFAANCVLPARAGEFVRAGCIGHVEEVSASSAFATIVVERLFDGFTLLLFLLIGLMVTPFPAEWERLGAGLQTAGGMVLAFYILLSALLVGLRNKAEWCLGLLDRCLFFVPQSIRHRIAGIMRKFSEGIILPRGAYRWGRTVLYTFLLWSTSLFQIHFTGLSLGLNLPFQATFLIMALASLGVMLPSAPGFVGTFHLSVQYGFLMYGTGNEEALSGAILWHAGSVFPTILFGAAAFLFMQVPLSELGKEAGKKPQ